jgi:CheY-like chemotaxis protein
MNILLADDDSTSRDLMRRVIALAPGHTVTEVSDGEEAWALLEQPARHFDLALLDVTMPRLDGIGVLERIRSDVRLKKLPVILCTAHHDRQTVQRAVSLAVNHFIVKPYTREFVLEKLRLVAAANSNASVEDRAVVAQRLGMTEADIRDLTHRLLRDVRAVVTNASASLQPDEFTALAVNANGLRGASFNLGFRNLGQLLEKLEQTFRSDFAASHRSQFPLTHSEVLAALEPVTAEIATIVAKVPPAA